MNQLTFLKPTIKELYRDWKLSNAHVVAEFNIWADFSAKHGKKFGAKFIWEKLRWERHFKTGGDEFKCNNNWTAYLMRDWIRTRPHWAHLVETRNLKGGT